MSGEATDGPAGDLAADPAALYAELTRPILVILDAEVRELAEAWNTLMQLPERAGETRADHLDAGIARLRQARQVLRQGLECAP